MNWLMVWLGLWLPALRAEGAQWRYGVLAVLAFATLAAGLARQLPAQNVFLACILLLLAGAGLYLLNLATGIPLGIRVPDEAIGRQLFWVLPLTWATAVLGCRGVARLALRPLRGTNDYGYWVLGTTAVLAVLFELTLQPFATSKGFWSWTPTKLPYTWYGTPWVTFFGWAVSALVMLICITPALINKSPMLRAPDYFPMWIWLLLKILFATGAAMRGFWGAAALAAGEMTAVVAVLGTSGFLCPPRGRDNVTRQRVL